MLGNFVNEGGECALYILPMLEQLRLKVLNDFATTKTQFQVTVSTLQCS